MPLDSDNLVDASKALMAMLQATGLDPVDGGQLTLFTAILIWVELYPDRTEEEFLKGAVELLQFVKGMKVKKPTLKLV